MDERVRSTRVNGAARSRNATIPERVSSTWAVVQAGRRRRSRRATSRQSVSTSPVTVSPTPASAPESAFLRADMRSLPLAGDQFEGI